MKKYIGIMAGLLMLAGCTNDDAITQQGVADGGVKKFTSFTATVGDMANTRAYLEPGPADASERVFWEEGDRITVYSNLDTQQYEAISCDSNTALFAGNEISGNEFYALYPTWNWEPAAHNPTIWYFNLWGDSSPHSNNDFDFIVPMVAKSTNNTLSFKQVVGLIHVTVGGVYNIRNVSIRGNNGEILGSRGYVDLSEDEPVFRIDENESTDESRGVYYGDVILNGNYKDIYFTVPPMTFEKGITLTIESRDEEGNWQNYTKTTSSALVVGRGTVKHFNLVDVNAELAEKAAGYDEIVASQLNAMEDQQTAQALSAFYKSLNGGYWTNISKGWGRTDDPVEEWEGLSFMNGQLRGIDLQGKNLKGDIPAAIQNLTMLNSLYLSGNKITSVPDELWQMGNLKFIILGFNLLSGPLPAVAANSGVERLNLSNNNFEGSIPDEWFSGFGSLKGLTLNGNRLSDTITEADMATNMWQNLQDWQIIFQQEGYGVVVPGYVSQILLNATELTLRVGEPFQLEVTVLPESMANVELDWWYDDETLSIDKETGTITALEPGCWTTITIHANDGSNVEAYCNVNTVPEDYEE